MKFSSRCRKKFPFSDERKIEKNLEVVFK